MRYVMLFVLITNASANLEVNRNVLKAFSYMFGLKMFECGEKTNYTQEMAKDILYFWDANRQLNNIETGCLFICAMMKLELLDSDGELVRPNAEGFVKANGAEDTMAEYLIDLYTKCKAKATTITNGCEIALEVSRCFKRDIREKGWILDTTSLFNIPHD